MADLDLAALMAEIGPMDEAILMVSRLDDGRWIVAFSEVNVEVEHDEATGRLMFSTLVAPAAKGREIEVYEALLLYSSIWRETGGIRMGLAGPGGDILQMADVFVPDATTRTVVTIARNLAERALVWRQFVSGRAAKADAAADGNTLMMSNFIRG